VHTPGRKGSEGKGTEAEGSEPILTDGGMGGILTAAGVDWNQQRTGITSDGKGDEGGRGGGVWARSGGGERCVVREVVRCAQDAG